MSVETQDTVFLPGELADDEVLRAMHHRLTRWTPFTEAVKECPDPIAFLNEQRQIVIANRAFAELCQLEDPSVLVGQRMGDALSCVVAPNTPGGCGTGYGCRKCRLVNAIFTGLRWGGATAHPKLHVMHDDSVDQVAFRVVIESVVSGNDRVLFCRLHSGVSVAMDVPQEVPGTPTDLFELHHLLVNGGPFCPY